MSTPKTQHAQLAELQSALRAASVRAEEVVSKAGERILTRPRPDSWSVAECLTHLRLSMEPYFRLWNDSIHSLHAAGKQTDRPYRRDFWGWALVWSLEPPPKFRFGAPPRFQPVETGPAEQVLPSFLACQQKLLELLEKAEGLPIDRIRIRSPFDNRVKYSVWSSFCMTAAHHRRHLWQAGRALSVIK